MNNLKLFRITCDSNIGVWSVHKIAKCAGEALASCVNDLAQEALNQSEIDGAELITIDYQAENIRGHYSVALPESVTQGKYSDAIRQEDIPEPLRGYPLIDECTDDGGPYEEYVCVIAPICVAIQYLGVDWESAIWKL